MCLQKELSSVLVLNEITMRHFKVVPETKLPVLQRVFIEQLWKSRVKVLITISEFDLQFSFACYFYAVVFQRLTDLQRREQSRLGE